MPKKYSTCMPALVATNGTRTPVRMKCAPLPSRSTVTGKRRRSAMRMPPVAMAKRPGPRGAYSTASGISWKFMRAAADTTANTTAIRMSAAHGFVGAGRV